MATPIDLSPRAFLNAAFPHDLLKHYETPLISRPVTWFDERGELHESYKQIAWHRRANPFRDYPNESWLYCVSTVVKAEKARRRLRDLCTAFVLPLDDIGTKAKEPSVSPSYILETSPGNYQWGYFIDPYQLLEVFRYLEGRDVAPLEYFDACLLALAEAGYNDPGCRSASRLVKLPGAVHHTGFVTRCTYWAPQVAWDLEHLVETAFNLEVDMERTRRRSTRYTDLDVADVVDPILEWLRSTGRLQELNDRGYAVFECPWAGEHSSGLEAGYSPLDYVTEGRHFHCYHGSCADRTWVEFARWVHAMDGPVLTEGMN